MRNRLAWQLALILLLLGLIRPAQADERIIDFSSRISVNADASLDVLEKIVVRSAGALIRHGIYRDISVPIDPAAISAERDGNPEPYVLKRPTRIRRSNLIRIGQQDMVLPPGLHSYTLTYHVIDGVTSSATADAIAWHVTGADWPFPIDSARIDVILPKGAQPRDPAAFTGGVWRKRVEAKILAAEPGRFAAVTAQPLRPGEGFTITFAWQTGLVAPAMGVTRLWNNTVPRLWQLLDFINQVMLTLLFLPILLAWIRWRNGGNESH